MIGERIKLARTMAAMSLRDVAQRADLSAQAISKYERGEDKPGSGALLRLARALEVPVEFFLRPAPAVTITPAFRKHADLPDKKQDALLAHVQEWVERYLEVEALTPDGRRFTWPEGFPYPAAGPEDAEYVAGYLRDAWKLGLDPIENLTDVLEDQGIKVGLLPDAPDKFDACSFYAEADGRSPVIAVNGRRPGDRQRFDLAHDVAHLALDIPEGIDQEKLAHRFAAAFLVPAPCARAELGQDRHGLTVYELHLLKHKWGMSMQAWVYRARDLGIITEATAARLFRQFSARGWRKEEPGDPYPPEKPTRMARLVLRALAEEIISEHRAAELLGQPLAAFQQRVAEEHGGLPALLGD